MKNCVSTSIRVRILSQSLMRCVYHTLWMSILCCILGVVNASGGSDELDVNILIDRIQAQYDHTQALTAEFVQVATLTSIDRQQTSTGRLFIAKPHHIRWEYTQPDSQTILYDGSLLRIYTPKRRQVLQSTIDEDNRRNVALLFLAGVGKLREAFTITPLPNTNVGTRNLRLLPQSPQASFTELQIAVSADNYFIEHLLIHDTIGNITEIHLHALQTHTILPPQAFELVLPPETEILTPTESSGQQ